MFIPRIIPILLMKNGGLVKTVKFSNSVYVGDPMNAVKIFNEMESDELIFLDILATVEKRKPNPQLIRKISEEAYMPFAFGGGISSFDDVKEVLKNGAEKVVFGTALFENPDVIRATAEHFGNQSVIVCIDVKKNWLGKKTVRIRNARQKVDMSVIEAARMAENLGAGEIMIQSVDLDGTMKGYDLELIRQVSENVKIPVIAAGGCGNLQDCYKAIEAGASAAAAGSIFVYHGPRRGVLINYPTRKEIQEIFSRK